MFHAMRTTALISVICQLVLLKQQVESFTASRAPTRSTLVLQNGKFERDIEENSRRKAQGGTGETLAGAVLGGMLLGPFGALFGAQIGANLGANKALEKARKEEMKRLGVTEEMLNTAQDCGLALERSIEGLKATQDSLQTQQSFAKILDRDASDLYDKAKAALEANNEEQAKDLLFARSQVQEKLKGVLIQCAEAKKRLETMENNVAAIERRAKEVEALLQRTIAAKVTTDLTMDSMDFSLSREDPLLKKFRDAGIE
jgi:phage shock protein A